MCISTLNATVIVGDMQLVLLLSPLEAVNRLWGGWSRFLKCITSLSLYKTNFVSYHFMLVLQKPFHQYMFSLLLVYFKEA